MALSDDQRALLRLLAKREEGYEDIAALKGLSVEEVRAEVKAALAELDSTGEEPPPAVAAPPPVEASPPPPKPPKEEPKAEPTPSPPAAARTSRVKATRPRPSVPVERRRFLALVGGALAVVAVVGLAIAVFSGDSGGSDSGSTGSSDASTEAAAAVEGKVTQAVLAPADGGDASGRAIFGRLGKKEIVLQVTAERLEPTADGESYTVWLYRTPKLSLRVGSATVDDSGQLGARFPIPAELLAYVASGAFDQIYVSRTSDAAYQEEVAQARKNKTLPRYSGETVLTGEITGPVVKAGSGEGG